MAGAAASAEEDLAEEDLPPSISTQRWTIPSMTRLLSPAAEPPMMLLSLEEYADDDDDEAAGGLVPRSLQPMAAASPAGKWRDGRACEAGGEAYRVNPIFGASATSSVVEGRWVSIGDDERGDDRGDGIILCTRSSSEKSTAAHGSYGAAA